MERGLGKIVVATALRQQVSVDPQWDFHIGSGQKASVEWDLAHKSSEGSGIPGGSRFEGLDKNVPNFSDNRSCWLLALVRGLVVLASG